MTLEKTESTEGNRVAAVLMFVGVIGIASFFGSLVAILIVLFKLGII